RQIDAAKTVAAPFIEIHTGGYADAETEQQQAKEFAHIKKGVEYAHSIGLHVNAGHGLHYHNVEPIAALPQIIELNIGHSIVARSVFTGLAEAVREMKQLLIQARA
ncbi:MAG TPA: pyridoxine 5'-phosphate synthase, partial [Pseudomonadales bacterium]|nr:pyridoxine 5'-phosphate synthase [Pseudomonadales bacterium]